MSPYCLMKYYFFINIQYALVRTILPEEFLLLCHLGCNWCVFFLLLLYFSGIVCYPSNLHGPPYAFVTSPYL